MQAQTKSLTVSTAADEGLKQALHGNLGNRLSLVRHPEDELVLLCNSLDLDSLVSITVGKRVAEKVGHQLSNPDMIARDRFGDRKICLDVRVRGGRAKFPDDLLQDRLQRLNLDI